MGLVAQRIYRKSYPLASDEPRTAGGSRLGMLLAGSCSFCDIPDSDVADCVMRPEMLPKICGIAAEARRLKND